MRSTASQGNEGRIYNEKNLKVPLPNPLLKGEGTFIECQTIVEFTKVTPSLYGRGLD
jgi:hypothetical protein